MWSSKLKPMLHLKYNSNICYCKVPEVSNSLWKYDIFLHLNPLGKISTKKIFDTFCGTNISSTEWNISIKPIYSTASLSELVLLNRFIWVSIIMYVNNGTTKVPILAVGPYCLIYSGWLHLGMSLHNMVTFLLFSCCPLLDLIGLAIFH